MNVSLSTEDYNDVFDAYAVRKLELKAIGDQTQVSLQAEGVCGMSATAYVRTLHFTAEVGTLPERFFPKIRPYAVVRHNTGEVLAYFDTLLESEAYITGLEIIDGNAVSSGEYVIDGPIIHFCQVSWIDSQGKATPHTKPRLAAYLAKCNTANVRNIGIVGVCQEHYDMYLKHGVQLLTIRHDHAVLVDYWDFEKL